MKVLRTNVLANSGFLSRTVLREPILACFPAYEGDSNQMTCAATSRAAVAKRVLESSGNCRIFSGRTCTTDALVPARSNSDATLRPLSSLTSGGTRRGRFGTSGRFRGNATRPVGYALNRK